MLRTSDFIVKICGITSEADALMSVSQGATAIGFVFAPSPRRITAEDARDIVRRLPPGYPAVGVFRTEERDRVIEIAAEVGLAAVQLHGYESVEDVAYIRDFVPTVIKALASESSEITDFDRSHADYLLLDGENPGSGELHEWGPLGRHHLRTPILAAGGLTPYNVGEIARTLPVAGVDVSTGVEESPGRKDPVLVASFIRAARQGRAERLASVGVFPVQEENE